MHRFDNRSMAMETMPFRQVVAGCKMMSIIRYRELIRNLVSKDLKLKYRGSMLGFLWSLANPLLLILVYGFVFTQLLRAAIPNFAYFLLIGLLPWNFFAQSMLMSTGSILDNAGLFRQVWVPLEVFPVATVLFNLAQFLFAFALLMPMALLFFQIPLAWSFLGVFLILTLHVLFTVGLSFFFSAITVFYRDVRHFMEIFLMLLFWLTPIIYNVEALPSSLRTAVHLNPLSFFISSYQDIFYRRMLPGFVSLLTLCGLTFLSLTLGYWVFSRCKSRFAEEV